MQTMGNFISYRGVGGKNKKKHPIYTFSVYVLRLYGDKYYVGISKDVNRRVQEHKQGEGSKWTKMYPPIEVVKKIKTDHTAYMYASENENSTTIEYMKKYGRENVRGGIYCAVDQDIVDSILGTQLCREIDKAHKDYLEKREREEKKRAKKRQMSVQHVTKTADANSEDIIKSKANVLVVHSSKNAKQKYVNSDGKKDKLNTKVKTSVQEYGAATAEEKTRALITGKNRYTKPIKKKVTKHCNRPDCSGALIKMSYGSLCSVCGQRYVFKK